MDRDSHVAGKSKSSARKGKAGKQLRKPAPRGRPIKLEKGALTQRRGVSYTTLRNISRHLAGKLKVEEVDLHKSLKKVPGSHLGRDGGFDVPQLRSVFRERDIRETVRSLEECLDRDGVEQGFFSFLQNEISVVHLFILLVALARRIKPWITREQVKGACCIDACVDRRERRQEEETPFAVLF